MPRARRRSPALEIRPATPEDLPALARLGAKLARAHHAWDPARFFLPEEPIEEGYAWWLGKELRNRRAVILAAERRGRVLGYAYGRLEPRDWNMLRDACGVAVDLWVEPGARRAGLGGRLTDALAAALEARGAERVVLYVASRNPAARRLFRRLRFRPTLLELARERRAAPNEAGPGRRRGRTLGA
ncbi:MAG TPA: GNAT family N-acetyltransferase [Anaeromyxobacter sp.]